MITDSSNKEVWRWDSDPFGMAAANEDPDGDGNAFAFNLRFPGQYYDEETGRHYNYFRDYDPTTGRFTTSDPTGLLGGLNTYIYAPDAPIKYFDPNGAAPVGQVGTLVLIKCVSGLVVGSIIESATEIGTCCYKQCGWKLWRCDLTKCEMNRCNIAVSAFASCVASAAVPNAPAVPATWHLLKPFLKKLGMNSLLKEFGKWGCK